LSKSTNRKYHPVVPKNRYHTYASHNLNNIPKKINILTVKNKLKRKGQEKFLECEINAQKDKQGRDKAKSLQEITH
jgi:uncharacterized phage-associated protein